MFDGMKDVNAYEYWLPYPSDDSDKHWCGARVGGSTQPGCSSTT